MAQPDDDREPGRGNQMLKRILIITACLPIMASAGCSSSQSSHAGTKTVTRTRTSVVRSSADMMFSEGDYAVFFYAKGPRPYANEACTVSGHKGHMLTYGPGNSLVCTVPNTSGQFVLFKNADGSFYAPPPLFVGELCTPGASANSTVTGLIINTRRIPVCQALPESWPAPAPVSSLGTGTLTWSCSITEPYVYPDGTTAGEPALTMMTATNPGSSTVNVSSITVSFAGYGQTQYGNSGGVPQLTTQESGSLQPGGSRTFIVRVTPAIDAGPTSCLVTGWS